ncbi:tetratricopeptide repeat protein [Desulfovibrio aerotolerans]|uniref:Tetratricopeptide repeat protein n=1 Tax=Solidesulfovibrio aerotolerans TaxID=295255 RepID=A0A7C9MJ69_9BACT|nr:tetratricopeptide repeat protein [Solidesulfovibrio aerotolerans]MYL81933.1 tetratricopeptide repeat protein [Solidesulfovibrio aerotolerans]
MDDIVTITGAVQQEQETDHESPSPIPCRILGVYSLAKAAATGHGATARTYEQKTYWFVRRTEDDEYLVQALNGNAIPSGPLTTVSKGEFIRTYHPEAGYYEKRCLPFIDSLKKKLAQADKHLAEEDLDGAEKEFCKALLLDEKHPKANIELGKIHMQKGDGKKLASAMRRILSNDALFQEQERHLFNDFGITLRKEKHFAEAISFYAKALEHNSCDENLHFNIARALAESGNHDAARTHLDTALALRPDFEPARRYRDYLDKVGTPMAGDAQSDGAAP